AFEPGPEMLGETVEHEDLERRHLVDLAEDDIGAGESGLRTAAGAEDARMQIDACALDEQLAGAGPGNGNGRARLRNIGHSPVHIPECCAPPRRDLVLAAAGADDQPLVGAEPETRERALGREAVRFRGQAQASYAMKRIGELRIVGSAAQVDLAAMRTLAHDDIGTGRVGWRLGGQSTLR